MNSHLKDIVAGPLSERKIELTSFQADRIRDLERKLDGGKISIEDVIVALHKEFSYHLEDSDYRGIKKQLERRK